MNRKVLVQIGIGVILVLAIFLVRCAKDFRMPSFGGQETAGSGPVPVAADVLQYYLQGADLPTTFQLITGGQVPQELVDKFLAGKITGITKGSPVIVAAPLSGQSSTAPTYTPTATVKPTRTPTPVVQRPVTTTGTMAFPPADVLALTNANAVHALGSVGGVSQSSAYWLKFAGDCGGGAQCRGGRYADVPTHGTFYLPPTLVVISGTVKFQSAEVEFTTDSDNRKVVTVVLGSTTVKDLMTGSEDQNPEWVAGVNGKDLILLKVMFQRWDEMTLRVTIQEALVFYGGASAPGVVKATPVPTATSTATPTATKPAAKNPTPTPTKGR